LNRLELKTLGRVQATIDRLCKAAELRLDAIPSGVCPAEIARNFLTLCQAQTCGKCAPCRIGLAQLLSIIDQVLDGNAAPNALETLETTAQTIADAADCAIGVEAAKAFLTCLKGFRDDFEEHIKNSRCLLGAQVPVPCVAECPANVDIPGYIALIRAGRVADAIRLIRKDNPFPTVCGYVCEHPCETRCRRGMVDAPLNIRVLKRFAADRAGEVPQPPCAKSTGKRVAVVGAGPSGLTVSYYLALMGHDVAIYERQEGLGGMLRYGIPAYRLPRDILEAEIRSILQLGVKVKPGVDVGTDVTFKQLREEYDALYISIGAHTGKKLRAPGEDAEGVYSAVQLLREVGDEKYPDFTGKRVVVIGGGNVAMDVTRSSLRFGAEKVICAYRRRQEDMTARPEEVEGAIAEGAQILAMHAPVRIETDASGKASAVWLQPQIVGMNDSSGRPRPLNANKPELRVPADVVIIAIGQDVETDGTSKDGFKLNRGAIVADNATRVDDMDGVFTGGDCATGPTTVIRAIAAGKVAAANIDEYLGFQHKISVDVKLPAPEFYDINACGRVNTVERDAAERRNDLKCVEIGASEQEARYEASRCLRCDHFGYGSFRGGREEKW